MPAEIRETTARQKGRGSAVRRVIGHPLLRGGSAITLLALILLAVLAPVLTPFDPLKVDLGAIGEPPSWEHWFGTDTRGMDVLTRVLHGARLDLSLAILGVLVALLAAMVTGGVAAYFGGVVDDVVTRIAEMLQSIPMFLFAFLIVAALGGGYVTILVVISVCYWPIFYKIVRAIAAPLMKADYVAVAQTAGRGGFGIVLGHIVPNSVMPMVAQAAINIGYAIQVIAGLSFLGLGIPVPQPEWGAMISVGAPRIAYGEWWMAVFPGLALLVTVIALDGLSRRLTRMGNF